MVFDEDTDVVKLLHRISRFYNHESCGQCTLPRRDSLARQLLRDFLQNNGSERKLNRLQRVGRNMEDYTCALGDAASMPIVSFLKKFPTIFDSTTQLLPEKVMKSFTLMINRFPLRRARRFSQQRCELAWKFSFRYHPALSVVATCRMCLVDVTDLGNGRPAPKLTSCSTDAMPNMRVSTKTTRFRKVGNW